MVVINLLEVLDDKVKEEELVEGMEEEEEEDGPEYDEHVWLSLKNASVLADSIASSLASIDEANAETYRNNAARYQEKMGALDQKYQTAVSSAGVTTLLFGDRFPFRYLADDYGLSYYAAFAGCSAETEASFETIVFLAKKVDELSLGSILTIEGKDHRIAETIRDNTVSKNQQILTMDSMQSTTLRDAADGSTYLSIMENNLQVLKEALKVVAGNENTVLSTTEGIDVDLTSLSSTMVYAEVYNMMCEPESYIGKTIKMDGLFAVYHDESTGNNYYACIIQDATACCAQGIEFVLTDEYSYPDDYPEEGGQVTVEGVFDTYMEGDNMYCTLREAKLV